jgi:hypothetical protein
MSSDVQRRESAKSASFHDHSARELYARRFGAIGISAVAAGLAQSRSLARARRATPAARDIPAILRFGPEAE